MEKSLPLISVVMATYNGGKFLSQQLDSVLEQTYCNLEIIISDDCSTDTTWDIIEQYVKQDHRITAYQNEVNLGYIKNFEKGIGYCKGDYVAICDQDDIWYKEKIDLLMEAIQQHDLCFCDSELIDECNQSLNKKLSDIKRLGAYTCCLPFVPGNCISGHATLIKRETLLQALPFPDSFVYDWYLAFFTVCIGSIAYLNQPLVQYRQHRNSSIAAVKVKNNTKKKKDAQQEIQSIRNRIKIFYEITERFAVPDRIVLKHLYESYQSFSLYNNFKRFVIFFRYRKQLLAIKKKSPFRKWLFCLKMFFKII